MKGGNGNSSSNSIGKRYSLEKAKQIVAMMRADGLDAYYTKGKKPNRTLQKAFDSKKAVVIKRAKQLFGELGK